MFNHPDPHPTPRPPVTIDAAQRLALGAMALYNVARAPGTAPADRPWLREAALRAIAVLVGLYAPADRDKAEDAARAYAPEWDATAKAEERELDIARGRVQYLVDCWAAVAMVHDDDDEGSFGRPVGTR